MRSQNGWTASDSPSAIGVKAFVIADVSFPGGVRSGDVARVLGYVARQFHARVEPLHPGWCWGYSYRPNRNDPDSLSNHSSGTAIDINAPAHPNGKAGTFSTGQVRAIRAILAACDGVVRWGGDYRTTKDEMHFEINAGPTAVRAVAQKLSAPANHPAGTPSWFYRTLRHQHPHMAGGDVTELQKALYYRGILAREHITGAYDHEAMTAVDRFRRSQGMTHGTVFDTETARRLHAAR